MSDPFKISDKFIQLAQKQAKLQTGEDVDPKRLRAFMLLEQLKHEINRQPDTKFFKLFWQTIILTLFHVGTENYFSISTWVSLMKSIKNAQEWVLIQPAELKWEDMIEQIKIHVNQSQLPILEKYTKAVEETLK